MLLPALKDASALDFRNSMHPLAVIGLYTQPLQTFVMERFSKYAAMHQDWCLERREGLLPWYFISGVYSVATRLCLAVHTPEN